MYTFSEFRWFLRSHWQEVGGRGVKEKGIEEVFSNPSEKNIHPY